MTKAEAASLLGVAEEASIGDVRRRYEALHNDYQIRLTNAPTPALKRTYQQKLQELIEACELLHPGFASATVGGDLPSAEPLISDAATRRATSTVSSASRRESRTSVAPASTAASDVGLPKSTLVAGTVAVVLAAALSFAGLRWWKVQSQVAALDAEKARLTQSLADVSARVSTLDALLYSDRLRVRNLSQKAVRISAAAFLYRDASGAIKLAHSGNYDYPSWEIRPGAVGTLDAEMARGRAWDGPVLYYALLIEYPGVEPFLKAGVWADDVDRLDKVVTLNLD